MPSRHLLPLLGLAAGSTLALTGCATDAAGADDDTLDVLASIYPLQYVAEQVGGDLVTVSSLTPLGAEPHDLEMSPRQVRALGEADVVVVLSAFQPSVDDAVAARTPEHLVDAAANPAVAAHLTPDGGDEPDDGHDHDGADPHFWLDPTLLAAVAGDVARTLGEADPDHAAEYLTRAAALTVDLTALDEEYATGLATCERRVVVTAHAAFGYLSERYDLEQVGISGLDPESEPSPARVREIRDVVSEHDITTLFTEVLVNPKVAETLAADLGITTAVLDPVESQSDPDADYRDAMDANLTALRGALSCA